MLVTFCTAFYRWRTHYWCRESNVRSGGYGCQQMHHIGLDGVNLLKCIHPGKWGIFKYSLDFCLADIGKVLKNHLTFSGLFLETKYACSCFNYISGQAWTTGIQQWLQSLASDVILLASDVIFCIWSVTDTWVAQIHLQIDGRNICSNKSTLNFGKRNAKHIYGPQRSFI